MSLLKNKIAVVTGDSSGIGLATAKRFVESAFVFITNRRQAELDKAVGEMEIKGVGSHCYIAFGSPLRWAKMLAACVNPNGRLGTFTTQPSAGSPQASWDREHTTASAHGGQRKRIPTPLIPL